MYFEVYKMIPQMLTRCSEERKQGGGEKREWKSGGRGRRGAQFLFSFLCRSAELYLISIIESLHLISFIISCLSFASNVLSAAQYSCCCLWTCQHSQCARHSVYVFLCVCSCGAARLVLKCACVF